MATALSQWNELRKDKKVVPNVRRQEGGTKEGGHEDEHLYCLRLLLVKLFPLLDVRSQGGAHLLSVPNLPHNAAVPEANQTEGNDVLGDHENCYAHFPEDVSHFRVPDDATSDQTLIKIYGKVYTF